MDSSSLPDNRLFAGVPATALREIADRSEPTSYAAGELVYSPRDADGALYVVLEGSVDGMVSTKHEQPTADSHAGDFFGEMALIHPGPRDAGARVTEPATVIRLSPESLEHLLALAPVPLMRNVAHRALEREAEHVGKRLEDMKLVVGGLAHDLRNPLGVIMGRMELLRDSLSSPAPHETKAFVTAVPRGDVALEAGELRGDFPVRLFTGAVASRRGDEVEEIQYGPIGTLRFSERVC